MLKAGFILNELASEMEALRLFDGNGMVRLLKPAPNVQQILELTRLHRVFEIVPG